MPEDKNFIQNEQNSSEDLALEEVQEDDLDIGAILNSWEIPSFHKHEKPKRWYFYFTIAIILLLIYAYFSKNPLFALILVFFTLLYTLSEKQDPKKLIFAIAEDGIVIENKFITYKKIKNFYIIYQPPFTKNLYFEPKNFILPVITIPLLDQNPVEIRKQLLQYLTEDLEKEDMPNSESIGHMLKL